MRMGEDNKQGEEVLLETMIFFFPLFLIFCVFSSRTCRRATAQFPLNGITKVGKKEQYRSNELE